MKRQKVKLDLYTFIFNDEDILPYFLDYYSFVDRMNFIDSGSTDKTHEILKDFSDNYEGLVTVYQTGLTWWDHEVLHSYRNNIWRNSRADYVLFPDCDEFFYHKMGLKEYLQESENDLFHMQGFEMVGHLPKGKITEVKRGVPYFMYNKATIFNPKIDIYFPNAHLVCSPTANVNLGELKLLHYRNMGVPLMIKRIERERSRLPANCSYRAFHSDEQLKKRYNELMKNAIDVI